MLWGKVPYRCFLIAAILVSFAWAQQGVSDLDGRAVNPLESSTGKSTVLVFLRRECPVSGRYAPVIQQIATEYSGRANFWLIYPDKSDSPEAIRKSVADYGYKLPVLRDPEHTLVRRAHVQITPEVAVFDPNGRLLYDGRIDNWYVDLSRARPAPTTHELEDALRAATAGQSVATREVRGVGCYISDLD